MDITVTICATIIVIMIIATMQGGNKKHGS